MLKPMVFEHQLDFSKDQLVFVKTMDPQCNIWDLNVPSNVHMAETRTLELLKDTLTKIKKQGFDQLTTKQKKGKKSKLAVSGS